MAARVTGSEHPVLQRVLTEKWPVSVLALGRFWFENRVRHRRPAIASGQCPTLPRCSAHSTPRPAPPSGRRIPTPCRTRRCSGSPGTTAAASSSGPPNLRLDGAELDAVIARQRDFFAARGQAVEWKTWGHDRPADLPRTAGGGRIRLRRPRDRARRARRGDGGAGRTSKTESSCARPRRKPTCIGWPPPPPRCSSRDSSWLADYLLEKKDDPNTVVVIAEADGQVVSSARLEIVPGTEFGGLWGGGTLERVARQGHLPRARGAPCARRARTGHEVPAGRRVGGQQADPGTPRVRRGDHDHRLRLEAVTRP